MMTAIVVVIALATGAHFVLTVGALLASLCPRLRSGVLLDWIEGVMNERTEIDLVLAQKSGVVPTPVYSRTS